MSTDKGNFAAEISDSVIADALKSVEQRKSGAEPAAAPEPSASANPTTSNDVPVEVEGAAPAAAPAPSERESSLQMQLEFSQAKCRELMEKLKEEHERALRAAADLDNFRKRAQKEKEEVARFGNERLLKDFLPLADNVDRAVDHVAKTGDLKGLEQGLGMIRKLFEDTLAKHGIKSYSALGKPFDPRLHEAMSQVETAQVPPHQVVSEMVRGYTLHDRLLRPALVTVAKAPSLAPPIPDEPAPAPPPRAAGALPTLDEEPPTQAADPSKRPSGGSTENG